MSALSERLQDLAELADAPSEHPAPHDTWVRGARFARRRRVGTAVIALLAVLALIGIGSLARVRAHDPVQPAGPNAPLGIPDRLYEPSPWLPGTDDEGPLGPIAAIIPAERKSWGSTSDGLVGVSATTGEYRFLDLPNLALPDEAVLSADGREVAYWATGPTRKAPNTAGTVVTGVSVYDTVTGQTLVRHVPTDHGLYVDSGGLWWGADGVVLVGYGQLLGGPRFEGGLATNETDWFTWTGTGDLVSAASLRRDMQVSDAYDGRIVRLLHRRYVVEEQGTSGRIIMRGKQGALLPPALDASGERMAYVTGDNRLAVADPDGAHQSVVPLPDRTIEVLGWTDATHVVRQAVPLDGLSPVVVWLVDVRDGSETLVTSYVSNAFALAADLMDHPPLPAVEPPHPLEPRTVTGWLAGVGVAGLLGLILWWRRVRP